MAQYILPLLVLRCLIELLLYPCVVHQHEVVHSEAFAQYFGVFVDNHGDGLRRIQLRVLRPLVLVPQRVNALEVYRLPCHLEQDRDGARVLVEIVAVELRRRVNLLVRADQLG